MPSSTTLKFDLERIMKNARVRLPGSLDDAIKLELFETMREFFCDSLIWQEDISIPIVADDTTYTVTTDAGVGAIVSLIYVQDADERRLPATMEIPGEIVLRNEPAAAATYTARVALTVTDPITRDWFPQIPDWILIRHSGGILDGVIGRMMSQIGKPYSSERMAIYHMRRFRDAVAMARVQTTHKNVYGAQTWRFPRFA